MNSTSPGAGPSLVGTVVDTARFDVERGKIREFARATGVVASVEELGEGFGVATVELTAARGKDPLVTGRASVVVRTG